MTASCSFTWNQVILWQRKKHPELVSTSERWKRFSLLSTESNRAHEVLQEAAVSLWHCLCYNVLHKKYGRPQGTVFLKLGRFLFKFKVFVQTNCEYWSSIASDSSSCIWTFISMCAFINWENKQHKLFLTDKTLLSSTFQRAKSFIFQSVRSYLSLCVVDMDHRYVSGLTHVLYGRALPLPYWSL